MACWGSCELRWRRWDGREAVLVVAYGLAVVVVAAAEACLVVLFAGGLSWEVWRYGGCVGVAYCSDLVSGGGRVEERPAECANVLLWSGLG